MKHSTRLFWAGLMLIVAATSQAAPRLVMSSATFDFGYAPQNSAISHVFWLKSTGDDTLKILKVVPGCSCTQAPLEKDVIAVGDSTRLEIIFHTKSYAGLATKRPVISTNEGPPDKSVQITTQVTGRPDSTYPIIITPYKLDFSQFTETPRDKITFKIANVSNKKLKATIADLQTDFFTLKLPNAINAGATGEGTLMLTPKALKDTSFEKSFTIQLDDDKKSRFTIPIKRIVQTASVSAVNDISKQAANLDKK